MIIDISSVLHVIGEKLDFEFSIDPSDYKWNFEAYKIVGNVLVKGGIFNEGDHLKIDAKVEVGLLTKCARCLEKVNPNVVIDIDDILIDESVCKDKDYNYTYTGKKVNISNIIYDNIVIQVPVKFLCSEECKGLCQKCGKNLNIGDCNCDKNTIDPRLAIFDELLKKKEN